MGQGGRDLPSSVEVALTLLQVHCEFDWEWNKHSGSSPGVYSLETPQGSYMNTWSHLNETHKGPAPNMGPLPLQVSLRLDQAFR